MSLTSELLAWSNEYLLPFGPAGLFILAFMESSFFPIPVEALLIPLILVNPELWFVYGAIAVAGSVTGSMLGYYIGKKAGRPILIKLAGERKTKKVEYYFEKYGDWGIAVGGFTPIPYKIFTIAAGVFKHSISRLLIVSAISRGARFFLIAGIVFLFGQQIITFMDSTFGTITIIISGAAFAIWYVRGKLTDKNRTLRQ